MIVLLSLALCVWLVDWDCDGVWDCDWDCDGVWDCDWDRDGVWDALCVTVLLSLEL